MASMAHEQYHAAGIFIALRPDCRGMQHLQFHRAGCEAISRADRTEWNTLFLQRCQGEAHARCGLFRKGWRTGHLSDNEPVEQGRQTVEMIEIGMGKEDFIDSPNAPAPEEWGDLPAGHVRTGQCAGIVDQDTAVRALED